MRNGGEERRKAKTEGPAGEGAPKDLPAGLLLRAWEPAELARVERMLKKQLR